MRRGERCIWIGSHIEFAKPGDTLQIISTLPDSHSQFVRNCSNGHEFYAVEGNLEPMSLRKAKELFA